MPWNNLSSMARHHRAEREATTYVDENALYLSIKVQFLRNKKE
jgi:hypothetical protein